MLAIIIIVVEILDLFIKFPLLIKILDRSTQNVRLFWLEIYVKVRLDGVAVYTARFTESYIGLTCVAATAAL